MTEWHEIEASYGEFVDEVCRLVESEPDITVGRIHRGYTSAMGTVNLHCGKSQSAIIWVEEGAGRDQLTPWFQRTIDGLRQIEARRVAEHEIIMGTMARFYVDVE